jgi:hypothetical protein
LEAGPCQGASGLQRAFGYFRWEIANLAFPFQTQLAIDTHIAVGDTQTIVTDTQTMVADIHRKVLTSHEGTPDQNNSVCATLSIDNGMLTIA